nr:immunoglobulin heavy chain junction region [Macaca mulatta]MOW93355.1 immunoglobulin heavy chain junction region [Macaca mulatta]MOW93429.1 immunoglobulin heavy chain junction region [Macaca mulatta]MOW93444.1 immunoglobulin heavy chain junction region [Macaca mulatta]MOW93614.1 immunoglobulin heavy chain junction region [Macaca mulatta]
CAREGGLATVANTGRLDVW